MKTFISHLTPLSRAVAACFTASTLLALSAPGAMAASWQECNGNKIRWNNSWTNMYISTTSFPAGSVWDSKLQNAMWHWNNVKGAGFNFYVGRDTDGTHSNSNGVNEIYLHGSEAGGALAVTFSRYHCYWLFGWHYGRDEADIAFNSNLAWSTGAFNYANLGSPYSFEGVSLHELGHALGLGHEDRWMSNMNSYYPNSGPLGQFKEWDPIGDDRIGVRSLYPDATAETDVAGSAFKRTGAGTSGLVSSPLSAARGSTINIEFTFSNLSTATKTFNIGFYLGGILLGTNTGAWGSAGATGTFSRALTIPAWVAPGVYNLNFKVDYDGAMGEANEGNNTQPMPRNITIY
ncbi:matrixin family metalloprotease [Chitinivorax sp. B]|uniref:matrixin family metalloprotease n=1 Tax=Chitinivorax sp. B TaxID=2502235 RepID=UPI0010F9A66E|nr:matrixin family metalloprotease [Chitinivorax sp. B]